MKVPYWYKRGYARRGLVPRIIKKGYSWGGGVSSVFAEVTNPAGIVVYKQVKSVEYLQWASQPLGQRANTRPPKDRYTTIPLLLPPGSLIHCSNDNEGNKCRASFAISLGEGCSIYGHNIITYKKGEVVRPSRKFSMQPEVCNSGIHFFFTKRSADRYAT